MTGIITLFLFTLSIIFVLKFIIQFLFKFLQRIPTPMIVSNKEQIFLYLAISYILTYLILLIG
jgi:hypothetical protein